MSIDKYSKTEYNYLKGGGKLEYVGTREAAKALGYSQAYVSKLCREGKFKGAEQDGKGSPWRIPIEEVRNWKNERN